MANIGEGARAIQEATGESVRAFSARTRIPLRTLQRIWEGRPVSPITFDRFAKGMAGVATREELRAFVVVRGVDVPYRSPRKERADAA
jgi:hypothetical protein